MYNVWLGVKPLTNSRGKVAQFTFGMALYMRTLHRSAKIRPASIKGKWGERLKQFAEARERRLSMTEKDCNQPINQQPGLSGGEIPNYTSGKLEDAMPLLIPRRVILPDGWTRWEGGKPQPADYINGPLFLRNGTILPPDRRVHPDQWSWISDHPDAFMLDDIIGYMPGYVKIWTVGDEGPADWNEQDPVLWNDDEIWGQGLRRSAIAWKDQYNSGKSSIRAYLSNETPPQRTTSLQVAEQRIEDLEACLRETRFLVGAAALSGFTDADKVNAVFTNNGKITELVPSRPEDRARYDDLVK